MAPDNELGYFVPKFAQASKEREPPNAADLWDMGDY